ncbi:hypothetical protein B566_EDAN017339 [Ephemera danica]|nr:hypothetical protein B566_EDAN017339 [Ephemera danica]
MSRFLTSLKGRLSLYLGVHSAAQRLLYPYGYSTNKRAPDDVIRAAEEAAAAAHKVRGTVYPTGNIAADLYPAYGVSVDYAAENADARFSYGWELPEGGATRYDPPPSEILPVAKEIWEGVKTLAKIAIPKPLKEETSVLIQSSTEVAIPIVPTVQSVADTVQSNPSASSATISTSNWFTLIVVQGVVHFLLLIS